MGSYCSFRSRHVSKAEIVLNAERRCNFLGNKICFYGLVPHFKIHPQWTIQIRFFPPIARLHHPLSAITLCAHPITVIGLC